jgi:hypothetical protein
LGEEGGINLYGFVGNNPTNYADPNGQNAIAIGLGGAGTLGAFGTAGVWTGGAALAGAAGYGITAWAIHDTWLGKGGLGEALYDWTHSKPKAKPVPVPIPIPMPDPRNSDRCRKEWRDAYARCELLLRMPCPPKGQTGGHTNLYDCARGFVSEECGGNPVSW